MILSDKDYRDGYEFVLTEKDLENDNDLNILHFQCAAKELELIPIKKVRDGVKVVIRKK